MFEKNEDDNLQFLERPELNRRKKSRVKSEDFTRQKKMRTGMKRTAEIDKLKCSLAARRILAGATTLFWLGCASPEQAKPPPPEVLVVKAEQKDVPIRKEWIGTLEGLVNAQIKPQVTGYLLRQT